MASCKDCVHVEVCREYVMGLAAARGVELDATDIEQVLVSDDCENFKDRSRFVELPCKAGDTVYYIANINGEDKINSAIVDEVAIYKSGTIGYDCGVGEIGFSSKSIGKRVFLTQAEAEQALKEREKTSGEQSRR